MTPSRSRSLLIPIAKCEWPKSARVVDCDSYYKYSAILRLEGLPPVCLLNGLDDELSPFSQSMQSTDELERQGMPFGFYGYEGLNHYLSTSTGNVVTQQMFQMHWIACAECWLESEVDMLGN